MNINVQFPSFAANSLQPQTALAGHESRKIELVPQTRLVEPYPGETEVGSEKDKIKANNPPPSSQTSQAQGEHASVEERQEGHAQQREEEQKDGEQNNQDRQTEQNNERDDDGKQAEQKEQEKQDQAQITALERRDSEVAAHERAHASVGGQYASAPSYQYQRGPNGQRYRVGGEVQISASTVPNEPRATIRKMQQVRRAALAPESPSIQDRRVAAQATATINQSYADLVALKQGSELVSRQSLSEGRVSLDVMKFNPDDKFEPEPLSDENMLRNQVINSRYYDAVSPVETHPLISRI